MKDDKEFPRITSVDFDGIPNITRIRIGNALLDQIEREVTSIEVLRDQSENASTEYIERLDRWLESLRASRKQTRDLIATAQREA